jgi:hypothetical protein
MTDGQSSALRVVIVVLVVGLVGRFTSSVRADTTIDTGVGNNDFSSWGETDTATFGQTFIAPADFNLTGFSFSLAHQTGGASLFRYYVMAWSGTNASGSVLYESSTKTAVGTTDAIYTADVGSLLLTPGDQYIAFLSTSEVFDGTLDGGQMAFVSGDSYSGGEMVFNNNGSDLGSLTSPTNWILLNADAVFVAHFTGVPEPASLCLVSAGGLMLMLMKRRGGLAVCDERVKEEFMV